MVIDKVYELDDIPLDRCTYLQHVPAESRVLEFGPAIGYTSRYLRDKKACSVTGFEYSPEAAQKSSMYCEQMIVGDIEDPENWLQIRSTYDVILFADVLEHLRQPEKVLGKCREIINSDGHLIISIPNIAHWTIRLQLLKGRFDYTETGLLDNTHLRFFTRKTLTKMIEDAGFTVEDMDAYREGPGPAITKKIRPRRVRTYLGSVVDKAAQRICSDLSIFQFFAHCRPKVASEKAVDIASDRALARESAVE